MRWHVLWTEHSWQWHHDGQGIPHPLLCPGPGQDGPLTWQLWPGRRPGQGSCDTPGSKQPLRAGLPCHPTGFRGNSPALAPNAAPRRDIFVAVGVAFPGGFLRKVGFVRVRKLCLSTALPRHRLGLVLCKRCHRTALFLKRSLLFCMLDKKVQYWKLKVDS